MKTYENYIILWKVSFFLSSLGNSPVDFFLKLQFQSINRTKLVCLGLVHENDDALSEIILSNGDVCALPHGCKIGPSHISTDQITLTFINHFALKCTWLFSRLQSLFVLKLLYLLLSALFLCLWINCSIL